MKAAISSSVCEAGTGSGWWDATVAHSVNRLLCAGVAARRSPRWLRSVQLGEGLFVSGLVLVAVAVVGFGFLGGDNLPGQGGPTKAENLFWNVNFPGDFPWSRAGALAVVGGGVAGRGLIVAGVLIG